MALKSLRPQNHPSSKTESDEDDYYSTPSQLDLLYYAKTGKTRPTDKDISIPLIPNATTGPFPSQAANNYYLAIQAKYARYDEDDDDDSVEKREEEAVRYVSRGTRAAKQQPKSVAQLVAEALEVATAPRSPAAKQLEEQEMLDAEAAARKGAAMSLLPVTSFSHEDDGVSTASSLTTPDGKFFDIGTMSDVHCIYII